MVPAAILYFRPLPQLVAVVVDRTMLTVRTEALVAAAATPTPREQEQRDKEVMAGMPDRGRLTIQVAVAVARARLVARVPQRSVDLVEPVPHHPFLALP